MMKMSNEYKKLQRRKRARELRQPKKLFREGSKTAELSYLLIEKGYEGYLTDSEIKQKICGDLLMISNRYERGLKVAQRIRSLVRDIRMRFGVWIGKVWVPEIEDFAWKVITTQGDFNQLIKRLTDSIERLQVQKDDMEECKSSKEYKDNVEKFYRETF